MDAKGFRDDGATGRFGDARPGGIEGVFPLSSFAFDLINIVVSVAIDTTKSWLVPSRSQADCSLTPTFRSKSLLPFFIARSGQFDPSGCCSTGTGRVYRGIRRSCRTNLLTRIELLVIFTQTSSEYQQFRWMRLAVLKRRRVGDSALLEGEYDLTTILVTSFRQAKYMLLTSPSE
jgi:hypothetical protein